MRYKGLAALLVISTITPAVHGADQDECVSGARVIQRRLPGFNLTISRYHDPSLPPAFQECRAIVRDQQNNVAFSAHEPALAVIVAGQDVNGDGIPDLVLEGYAGGMHGDHTYYVVSLGDKPGLVLKFETDAVPAKFHKNPDSGQVEIHTWDGAFFMFDGTSSAFSPYPDVYLRIDGVTLRNISTQHEADYDKAIRKMRKTIPPADFARLRVIDESWQKANEEEAASQVFQIALAYLYSGRASLAHKTIKEMWPTFDQDRVWKLILKTKRIGILSQVSRKIF